MYRGVLVGKPEGKRPLEKPRRRWEDNINILKLSASVLTTHNRSHHIQANTIRGFIESVLLTMGIMMTETCWVNLLWINIYTFVICWFFLLLHRMWIHCRVWNIIRNLTALLVLSTRLRCLHSKTLYSGKSKNWKYWNIKILKSLRVVLCGSETWLLAMTE